MDDLRQFLIFRAIREYRNMTNITPERYSEFDFDVVAKAARVSVDELKTFYTKWYIQDGKTRSSASPKQKTIAFSKGRMSTILISRTN